MQKGGDRKCRRFAEEEYWDVTETSFQVYDQLLTNISGFNYMGCIFMATGDVWTEVVAILRKSRNKRARMSIIMGWEVVEARTLVLFYKVVIQAVFPLGCET